MPSPQNDSFWRFLPCIPRGIPVARYATIALSLARRRRCHWMSLPLFRDGFDETWKRIVKLSPNHLMFWLQGLVFTGDTLFVAGLDPWNFPTPATNLPKPTPLAWRFDFRLWTNVWKYSRGAWFTCQWLVAFFVPFAFVCFCFFFSFWYR